MEMATHGTPLPATTCLHHRSRQVPVRNSRLKPTKIVSDLPFWSLRRRCNGCPKHVVLQGKVRDHSGKWTWLTKLAGSYPPRLCRAWASELAAAAAAPGGAFGHGDSLSRWEAELLRSGRLECHGCSQLPRCPRIFVAPFSWDCERVWTSF